MLTWLKKFVLDVMPSVAATIIGAYIVNHYIVPKSPAAAPAAVASTDSKAADIKASDVKASDATPPDANPDSKTSFEKGVAEKAAIEKTAEKVAADKAQDKDKASDGAAIDSRKHRLVVKPPAKPASVATTEPASPSDERRASDLVRAALERQRATSPVDTAKPAEAPHIQPVTSVSAVPSVPAMQPLPPAINVATPNPDVFEQGTGAPVVRQPYPGTTVRLNDPLRPTPPANIPSRPVDLRAEANASVPDRPSIADDVVSTAKSMFHAVMPR